MEKYLITHSLLSSWLYAMKGNPYSDATNEKDSYADFLTTLRREHIMANEAMQNGNDFEDLVADIIHGNGNEKSCWYDAARKVARIIGNGVLQFKTNRNICVRGMQLVLHGRLDALRSGDIIDIKFSKSYERGNFLDSTQHPTYFELVPEATRFLYIISNGTFVWTEEYLREDTPSILVTIEQFLDYLDANGLMLLYKEKWLAS